MTRPTADRSELNIIIAFDGSLDELTERVVSVTGLTFAPSDRYDDPSVWANGGDVGAGLVYNALASPFGGFDFTMDFWTKNEHAEHDYARSVFEKLKALDLPMVLLANGYDIELDRYDPPAAA